MYTHVQKYMHVLGTLLMLAPPPVDPIPHTPEPYEFLSLNIHVDTHLFLSLTHTPLSLSLARSLRAFRVGVAVGIFRTHLSPNN